MRFRSKLVAILIVPIVALVAVVGIETTARWRDASQASRLEGLITTAGVSADLAHELQVEAALSVDMEIGGAGAADLLAQRARTDDASAAFRALVSSYEGGDGPIATATGRTLDNLDSVVAYRAAVDGGGFATDALVRSFGTVTGSLLDWNATVAEEAGDPALALRQVNAVALARAADASARQWVVLETVFAAAGYEGQERELVQQATTEEDRQLGVFDATATTEQKALLRDTLVGSAVDTVESLRDAALAASPDGPIVASPTAWEAASSGKLALLSQVQAGLTSGQVADAQQAQASASQAARAYLAIALAVVLLSLLLAVVVSQAITRPMRRLTAAADKLATERLPALVEGLKNPSEEDFRDLAATLEHVEVSSNDEIGQLAQAFDTVQTVAVDVAVEQASLLRKGIGDIFVNLARRNQVLIDRQLAFLDQLESTEQDPDQLEQLFMLDHLATRMRRNAESLLVLAGVDSPRRRSKPVPLADVLRAAISEVEDYARIDITELDEVDLQGPVAVDLAHVLSELMENATQFSPPDSRVEVRGVDGPSGYTITLVDHGIGMTADAIIAANAVLSRPPLVSLALTRSLGFIVVGRLAARDGVRVRLAGALDQGVRAMVTIPPGLVAPVSDEPESAAAEAVRPAPTPPLEVPAPPATLPVPATLYQAVPAGTAFDDGLAWLMKATVEETPAALVEPPVALPQRSSAPVSEPAAPEVEPRPEVEVEAAAGAEADAPEVEAPRPVPPPAAERFRPPWMPREDALSPELEATAETTASGLTRRVPKVPEPDATTRPTLLASRRSPDEVRAMLSRYREGLSHGRTETPVSDDAEDGEADQ